MKEKETGHFVSEEIANFDLILSNSPLGTYRFADAQDLLKPTVLGAFLLFVLSLLKSTLLSTTFLSICESDKVVFFDLLDVLGVRLMEL